jgi:hypothetical protein
MGCPYIPVTHMVQSLFERNIAERRFIWRVIIMKKLIILILAGLFFVLASCDTAEVSVTPEQTPDIPEVAGSEEEEDPWCSSTRSNILHFYSEEELAEHFRNEDNGTMGTHSASDNRIPTHYYKLKNPPPGVEINHISIISGVIVRYDNESTGEDYEPTLWVLLAPYSSTDIETGIVWPHRPFPEESYIRELDGITYYIWKGEGVGLRNSSFFLWGAAWVNADGYYMSAQFPYRFTADEVLGYVSDLERVEIG